MSWDKMCIQDISWNNTTISLYCKTLMFREYQNIIFFCVKDPSKWPIAKNKIELWDTLTTN
jgi:hypothetical protein